MHRTTDVGSQSPNANRNLNMLSRIAGDDVTKNVVVATDGLGQITNTQVVLGGLFSFPSQFERYDGTKLSALNVMHSVLKKNPEPLRIQIELGTGKNLPSTIAGRGLIADINGLIRAKQAEDQRI
jgi:hypothetical protein